MNGKYVLVTTNKDRRGVFAGILIDRTADEVTLRDAQNCIYWSEKTRGVFGLAAHGPQAGSRIGPPVPELHLNGVTSVALMTEEAVEAWKSQPWS